MCDFDNLMSSAVRIRRLGLAHYKDRKNFLNSDFDPGLDFRHLQVQKLFELNSNLISQSNQ